MSRDSDCVEFLRWALPRLGLRWEGYRKVRRQVCRRASRRAAELGLGDLASYRADLERRPEEWRVLAGFTAITISRFYRDRGVFAFLAADVIPRLAANAAAAGRTRFEVWSAGCASGEEPYTVSLIWDLELRRRGGALELRVLGTDIDDAVLRRAERACYQPSSLKELPSGWLEEAFDRSDGELCLRTAHRRAVRIRHHDLRSGPPDGPFDLVLCRNLAFTYFALSQQQRARADLATAIRPGGALVLGSHERLPAPAVGFQPWPGSRSVYLRSVAPNGP